MSEQQRNHEEPLRCRHKPLSTARDARFCCSPHNNLRHQRLHSTLRRRLPGGRATPHTPPPNPHPGWLPLLFRSASAPGGGGGAARRNDTECRARKRRASNGSRLPRAAVPAAPSQPPSSAHPLEPLRTGVLPTTVWVRRRQLLQKTCRRARNASVSGRAGECVPLSLSLSRAISHPRAPRATRAPLRVRVMERREGGGADDAHLGAALNPARGPK